MVKDADTLVLRSFQAGYEKSLPEKLTAADDKTVYSFSSLVNEREK